ncbi:Acetylcholinesterase [Halotydeus destructor]|nr:Acetylcholinesterase [Halotydeus destructor]
MAVNDSTGCTPLSSKWRSRALLAASVCLVAAILVTVASLIAILSRSTFAVSIVDTEYGKIEGRSEVVNGKPLQVFMGIPFAAPPVGDLRLHKPRRPKSWKGIRTANRHRSACMQYIPDQWRKRAEHQWRRQMDISEDCLYLNVYVPGRLAHEASPGTGKPVMVWIHGGAFMMGAAHYYDPSVLAVYGDVIVVSINYRLGLLGFMKSYHSDQMPGNLGLHDQVAAIEWIRSNIDAFGGDKDQITLFGESAGGISVGYHMISYKSRDLFKRAIMQSGSPLTPVMMIGQESGPLKVEKVAKYLGCPYLAKKKGDKYATFDDKTYQCIRQANVSQLMAIQQKIFESRRDMGFYPIADNDFFPDHPYDSLKNSDFGDRIKSIMLGNNANEGARFLSFGMPDIFPKDGALPDKLTPELLAEKVRQFAPGNVRQRLEIVMKFMFGGEDTNSTKMAAKIEQMMSQLSFICPNVAMIDSFVRLPNRTAYYYQFNPKPSNTKHVIKWSKGALHHDEVQFVLGYPLKNPAAYTQEEIKLSELIMTDWTTFAKTGAPSRERKWPPCTKSTRSHLVYDIPKVQIKDGMPDNKCDEYFQTFYEEARLSYSYMDSKRK